MRQSLSTILYSNPNRLGKSTLMKTIEEIRAQAKARLDSQGIKPSDRILIADETRMIPPALALAIGLSAGSLPVSLANNYLDFGPTDLGQNRSERRSKHRKGSNRKSIAANKARRLRRIAKKSRQYNRRLKKGMRV